MLLEHGRGPKRTEPAGAARCRREARKAKRTGVGRDREQPGTGERAGASGSTEPAGAKRRRGRKARRAHARLRELSVAYRFTFFAVFAPFSVATKSFRHKTNN